ncbi:MAG TPA: sigma-70 family RNA polymerase sigma factor [Conexibacter sp.]
MEASTIPATAALAPGTTPSRRVAAGPLLRLRSDEQLVRLFRAGSDEAFRVIHDRYRTRLFAYARQMLGGSRADAEDALQDVFVRAYGALRANDREVSLRAWLYRIAHNRCVDELRRPAAGWAGAGSPAEVLELVQAPASDPMDAVERRESLRRLVEDVQRLPEQQRSALLMREISGMAYADLAAALDVTVPAVKSLLVRARIGLAQAAEARDTACAAIRADLADAHERGVRASGLVKRHLHDCKGCSAYKKELRALDARLAALVPALGPVALFAKLLGIVGGGSTGVAGGATAAGGAGATAAVAGGGAAAAGAGVAGISLGHVAAAVAVAVVSAGGAVEVHHQLAPHHRQQAAIHRSVAAPAASAPAAVLTPDATRRREAAEQLPVIPGVSDEPIIETPTLDGPGADSGGAAAPVEPPADTVEPVTPPPDGAVVEEGDAGATSGSATDPPPATGSSTDAPPPPPADEPDPAPPATSAAPASTTAPTAPPTSSTVGGASYQPHR